MGGHAPAALGKHPCDSRKGSRRYGIDAEIGSAATHLADERLRHESALEAAIDAELDTAKAHPFVAFVLFERRARQYLTHGFGIDHTRSGACCREIDVVANREQVALACLQHEVKHREEFAQAKASRDANTGDAVTIERS